MDNISKHVFRACDICHRDKTKCDGFPCGRCKMHQWTCTISRAVRRRGRTAARVDWSCDSCKRECTYKHLPPGLTQLEDLSLLLHDSRSSNNYEFDLEPGPLLSNKSESLTGEMAISSTDSLSSDKDQIGPSLTHSQPATPQQPDAVYTSDAHFDKPPFNYNFTTSQDTNDLEPAKDPIPDNFMQNTSLPSAAWEWINCSRRATAFLNTNPELYTRYSEIITGAFQSGRFLFGTAILNSLWDSKFQRDANQDSKQYFGPFCTQQGDCEPITIGDQISIHYVVFKLPECKSHFSTYNKGSLTGLAQLGSKDLWMFSAVLGQQLGGKFLCRKGSGIFSDCLVDIVTVNPRLGTEWLREKEQHSEATAGEATTSMNENALVPAIQDKPHTSSTLGNSGVNGTIGTSTPGEALPNERNSRSMRSLSSDSESNAGGAGAGTGAGASTGASTTDRDSKRRFGCLIKGCNEAFFEKQHRTTHMLTHQGEHPYTCHQAGCTKAFSKAKYYRRHEKRHEKSHEKRHEKRHEAIKIVPRPYNCDACPRAYSSAKDLKRHKRVVHGVYTRVKASSQACSSCRKGKRKCSHSAVKLSATDKPAH